MGKFVAPALAVAAAVVGLAAAVGPASAAARAAASPAAVTRAAVPAAAVPAGDRLTGVACLSAKNCVAVGVNVNQITPLSEIWNGSAWKTASVPVPVKGSLATMGNTVACPAVKSGVHCVAVGSYLVAWESMFGMISTWNGKAWKTKQAPGPTGTALAAVACPAVSDCVAVGNVSSQTNGTGVPFSVVWNGTSWRRVTTPRPAGTELSELTGVSCGSAAFCAAVGDNTPVKGAPVPLIEVWNGHAWSFMKVPSPKGLSDPFLNGVSCPSAKNCVAVGNGITAKGTGGFAEVWNGTSWSVTSPVAWPKGTTNPWLTGVSCAAVGRCVAAGFIDFNPADGGITGRAAAATWNGKAWSASTVAAPAKGKASRFYSVYCLPRRASFCAATGELSPFNSTNGIGLSGFWNGKSWKLVTGK